MDTAVRSRVSTIIQLAIAFLLGATAALDRGHREGGATKRPNPG